MNKKGFTLVELLAVILILSVLIIIGTISINAIVDGIRKNMLETKIDSIEEAAIYYGQNNMKELKETCTVNDIEYKFCIEKTVQELLDAKALESEEKDENGNIILKNNVTNTSMNEDTVLIYRKNNRVYAVIKNIKSNGGI